MTTLLRQKMVEDLQLHGLSGRTQDLYVLAVQQLAEHYHNPLIRLPKQNCGPTFSTCSTRNG